MKPVSTRKKLIQLVHVAKSKLGLPEEQYRALICELFSDSFAGSCSELSDAQLEGLLDALKSMGFSVKPKAAWKQGENFDHEASTAGLRAEIEEYSKARWGEGFQKPLNALVKAMFKVEEYGWLRDGWKLKRLKESILKLNARGPYEARRATR